MARKKTVKEEVAEDFGLMHDAVVHSRPRGAIKPRGGTRRMLRTDGGRNVSHGAFLESLLRRAELEVEVLDGKRPKAVPCERCRVPVPLSPKGAIPRWCFECRTKCVTCKKDLNHPTKPRACKACSKSDTAIKKSASEASKRFWASMTPEQRTEFAKKRHAGRSPEQRTESAKKSIAARTPEQRSATARKRFEGVTAEQRAERGRKAAQTKRRNLAAKRA